MRPQCWRIEGFWARMGAISPWYFQLKIGKSTEAWDSSAILFVIDHWPIFAAEVRRVSLCRWRGNVRKCDSKGIFLPTYACIGVSFVCCKLDLNACYRARGLVGRVANCFVCSICKRNSVNVARGPGLAVLFQSVFANQSITTCDLSFTLIKM